ncbi:MAG: homocysteine S-methyltransferase family protein, partial [Pyrinomonadaceae bacterium]|nr:homocysteine S-methyltransferase family protein [Pyrinomonadaceae bacterium]
MKNFRDLIESDQIYVFDGAMGTRLYEKGIYINRSYDELNLINKDLVREVHEEYVKAGADVIQTNTFSANYNKLQKFGLNSQLREINLNAVQI